MPVDVMPREDFLQCERWSCKVERTQNGGIYYFRSMETRALTAVSLCFQYSTAQILLKMTSKIFQG